MLYLLKHVKMSEEKNPPHRGCFKGKLLPFSTQIQMFSYQLIQIKL